MDFVQGDSKKNYYRFLELGQGGTFDIPLAPCVLSDGKTEPIAVQGFSTFGCYTCVGVYIPLSPTTCFAAHISASITGIPENTNAAWLPTPSHGASLQALVKTRLTNAMACFLEPDADGVPKLKEEHIKDALVVLGPRKNMILCEQYTTGFYIVQALRDLGIRDEQLKVAHGFLVDHEHQRRAELTWKMVDAVDGRESTREDDEMKPEDLGFQVEPEQLDLEGFDWNFRLFERQWVGYEESLDMGAPAWMEQPKRT